MWNFSPLVSGKMPRFTEKAEIAGTFNSNAVLPYGLTVDGVRTVIERTHQLLTDLNKFLVGWNYGRLEEMLPGNAFAGFLSNVVVTNIEALKGQLVRNRKVGGHPDLVPAGRYPDNAILRGKEGLEVKVSKQRGGWQGHNPEAGWHTIFVYNIDAETLPIENREPTSVSMVLAAELREKDWSFSGRKGTSRRTITASVVVSGMEKLRANWVYKVEK